MSIETYIALLHEGPTPTDDAEPVLCPLRPDGTPKPEIDHHGVVYQLLDTPTGPGAYDYIRRSAE
ncbi:hypothetical protein [Microbacterium pygmaeum]|uniref:hypothetical protein n=1 Tax=Microbacterium pygmaeum TaxID=370764 RepID=UPI001E544551|nr:hypothetical protein [Microbacterium pygmaeum]